MWRRNTRTHTLHMGYATGRETHPDLELPFEDWSARVHTLIERRTGRSDASEVEALTASTHCADLFLAISCDAGIHGAWDRFLDLYEVQIADRAATLSIGLPKRDRFVSDFLAELFKSGAESEAPGATQLGSYDGSASLMTWLIVLLHDKALRARERLESVQVNDVDRSVEQLRNTEHGARIIENILSAWHGLSSMEQLVIALHYRDDFRPRSMAGVLKRSETQIRHSLRESLESLRKNALAGLEGGVPRQIWLDFQMWFEHELDALTKSGRPTAHDPVQLKKVRDEMEVRS